MEFTLNCVDSPAEASPLGSRPRRGVGAVEIAILLASLVCSLLVLEVSLRLYHRAKGAYERYTLPPIAERLLIPSSDPELIYEWNPGWTEADFSVNAHAMAGGPIAVAKPEDAFRIAFLGDSITAGLRILPQNETFVAVMRSRLERELDPPLRIETLNFAVNGYSLLQSARMLETRALRFAPDLVIVQLCLNDPYPTITLYEDLAPSPGSRLWNFIERRLAPDRFWASSYISVNYDAQGIENLRRGLLRIAEASRSGPRVLLVLFPYLYAPAYSQWDFGRYHALYREAADHAGLAWLDLYEPFQEAGLLTAKPYPADALHPGAEGHALAAERILAELDRLGYAPLRGRDL